jgi:alkaline phosphatase D
MDPVFTHGVASFDPTPEAVLLWTRLSGPMSAQWVLARDPGLRDEVAAGEANTGVERDGTVVVDVAGLEPGTTYWYRFTAGGARSPVGRTRTLPGVGAAQMTLGLVSCADYSVAPLTVYRALAQREVDLVLHLGDYVYDDEGRSRQRAHEPPHPVRTLDDYRARIAQMRRDPDCLALHQRHPWATIIDDHDLADNAWRGGAKAHDDAVDGPWAARARAAMQARAEWLPTRRRDPGDVMATWRSLEVGDLAQLVLLDSRLYGRDEQAGKPGTLPVDAAERTILGPDQRAWALERIADLSRPWSLVANGVVVNQIVLRPRAPRLVARLLPHDYVSYDGEVLRDDQWDGYRADRARLAAGLARRQAGGGRTVLLSGDVHSSWAFTGPHDADGTPVAVEVVTPSVSSAPLGRTRWPVIWRALDAAVRRLEHVRFVDVTNRGFVVLHVTREQVVASWYWVDPYDPADRPEVVPARCLAVERADSPMRWHEAEFPAEPVRPGPSDDLHARPRDVRAARRRHRLRRAAGMGALVGAALAAVSPLARRLRR